MWIFYEPTVLAGRVLNISNSAVYILVWIGSAFKIFELDRKLLDIFYSRSSSDPQPPFISLHLWWIEIEPCYSKNLVRKWLWKWPSNSRSCYASTWLGNQGLKRTRETEVIVTTSFPDKDVKRDLTCQAVHSGTYWQFLAHNKIQILYKIWALKSRFLKIWRQKLSNYPLRCG